MPQKTIIACGGTGGHLFPGIAVAETLQERGHEVLCLISEKNVDAVATRGYDHLRFEKLPAIAMPRVYSPAMPRFLYRFWQTRRRCVGTIADFGASAVLGMGGFTSLPPVMAGKRAGARTFVHESNAVPGKANRFAARFCEAVLLGFEECAPHFSGHTTRVVGTPVRRALKSLPPRDEACRAIGLDPALRTLLIIGGSQGARGVNRAVCAALPGMEGSGVQLLHISGTLDHDEVKEAHDASPVPSVVLPFCGEMEKALAAADLAVARSGASTLSEFAAVGLPSILVPYPYAAYDHQARNAEVFTSRHAALMIEERYLSGTSLSKMVRDLLEDSEHLGRLAENCRQIGHRDAAIAIADLLDGAS